jgi:predicted transcriptional regulator
MAVKLYANRAWLYKRYVQERKDIVTIAKEAGCSHQTIQNHLERHGLVRKRG